MISTDVRFLWLEAYDLGVRTDLKGKVAFHDKPNHISMIDVEEPRATMAGAVWATEHSSTTRHVCP